MFSAAREDSFKVKLFNPAVVDSSAVNTDRMLAREDEIWDQTLWHSWSKHRLLACRGQGILQIIIPLP